MAPPSYNLDSQSHNADTSCHRWHWWATPYRYRVPSLAPRQCCAATAGYRKRLHLRPRLHMHDRPLYSHRCKTPCAPPTPPSSRRLNHAVFRLPGVDGSRSSRGRAPPVAPTKCSRHNAGSAHPRALLNSSHVPTCMNSYRPKPEPIHRNPQARRVLLLSPCPQKPSAAPRPHALNHLMCL